MSYARRLDRGLDSDLIARIEAGGKPLKHKQPKNNLPRPLHTYRAERRERLKDKRRDQKRNKHNG